ncbi:Fur family transcriptional regulator [Arthrobacter sp. zg-Y820]|uniref:Fur family transcriptional regulator n=1 Tax=unclassified Arthrobacter TaxID=235627 RepID=UPI001E547CAC|nr:MULTISPECIES: Fur family transcriptional regulator [unclassified Arthrobacter]MCC9195718.1 transcriptional repressor [Arthrobacter sp. zg-Y820]MDK1278577.1 Fur family transcriptional regulator [Arthrobacter sp. zg.Y820]WIB08990.1 Fur family transcriptional regulator [Arthrobacter sp. zg-Y820]
MTSTAAPTETTETWTGALRAHGRRVTKQRLAVLNAVERLPHSVADDVAAAVRGELPDISLQSVYVVLADLTDIGLLRKIEPPHSPARYETRVDDNHHHAICTECGRIEDVDCAVGHAPCLTPDNTHGMTIQIADVLYRGICADCAAKAS